LRPRRNPGHVLQVFEHSAYQPPASRPPGRANAFATSAAGPS